ncbi:hypothetical protein HUN07_05750 [Rhodococcus sp. W8901]|nr:hypothetical protein HUN07_05750 [Rhodococcus sp. W8901]
MELRSNGSLPGEIRPALLQDFDLRRSNTIPAVLWWVVLMLMVAAVPAVATVLLMGSVTLAMTMALVTVGGVGLAALMI